jgi:hypothetical protein
MMQSAPGVIVETDVTGWRSERQMQILQANVAVQPEIAVATYPAKECRMQAATPKRRSARPRKNRTSLLLR